MTARVLFALTFDLHRSALLSSNDRIYHFEAGRRSRDLRDMAHWRARRSGDYRTIVQRVAIVATVARPTRRRADAPNPAPTIKALVDGLVDSGLLADDADRYVRELTIRAADEPAPSLRPGFVRIVLELKEATA